jgi:galactokinase
MSADRSFSSLFGREPDCRAGAPGRVNLMGDHTDYNAGFVFPAAIPQRTDVELAPAGGRRVRAWSRDVGSCPEGSRDDGTVIEEYVLGAEKRGRGWLDYVQAVTFVAAKRNPSIEGFDLRIASSIPPGSGLSSSAALSVSLLRALRVAFELPLDDRQIAVLARAAENEFIGAPVGIMDPMAVTFATPDRAMFLDTRDLEFELVPLPRAAELAVVHSGVAHRNETGGYKTRRAECALAAARLGVETLRDLSPEDLPRVDLLEPPLDRRARHVVTENERVLETVAAFRDERIDDAGRTFFESHRSLAEDFEVSTPEIDAMIDLARAEAGILGARITGGGFGGAVVMLARRGEARRAARAIASRYGELTGKRATVLLPEGV